MTHPIGRFKARFFAALGFSAERWDELADAFRVQHLTQAGEATAPSVHGQKFTIRAILVRPNGRASIVVSVWFVPSDSDVPRFVTAYPGDAL